MIEVRGLQKDKGAVTESLGLLHGHLLRYGVVTNAWRPKLHFKAAAKQDTTNFSNWH